MGLEPPLQWQQGPGLASAARQGGPHVDGGGAADRVEQVCMYGAEAAGLSAAD